MLLLLTVPAASHAADYTVRLQNIVAERVRSHGRDTIHAVLHVYVNGQLKGQQVWDGKSCRDGYTEGRDFEPRVTYHFGSCGASSLQVDIREVQDRDRVQIVYQVLNAGHRDPSELQRKALDFATRTVSTTLCAAAGAATAGVSCAVGLLAEIFGPGLIFADCDGVVAQHVIETNGADLARKVVNPWYFDEYRHPGYDSPTGCGGNSEYLVRVGYAPGLLQRNAHYPTPKPPAQQGPAGREKL